MSSNIIEKMTSKRKMPYSIIVTFRSKDLSFIDQGRKGTFSLSFLFVFELNQHLICRFRCCCCCCFCCFCCWLLFGVRVVVVGGGGCGGRGGGGGGQQGPAGNYFD